MRRAERRHHAKRVKRRAVRVARTLYRADDGFRSEMIERFQNNVDHLAACSCPMCGNPRKWFGERTQQERCTDYDLSPL